MPPFDVLTIGIITVSAVFGALLALVFVDLPHRREIANAYRTGFLAGERKGLAARLFPHRIGGNDE